MYADDEAFTFMTPQGHQFAAWITFTAVKDGDTCFAQVQPMFRSGDPLFDLVLPIMTRMEDRFWRETLKNLAARFDVHDAEVDLTKVCLDRKRQWNRAGNVWHNAGVRSVLYFVATPFRWAARSVRGRSRSAG